MNQKHVDWIPMTKPPVPQVICPGSILGTADCRLAQVPNFSVPRVPPICPSHKCPIINQPDYCELRRRCHPPPPGSILAKNICPPFAQRDHHDRIQDILNPIVPRCETDNWTGRDRLTGYKNIGFALAIPKYGGFRPRFPHPYPKLDKKLPPCKEVPPPPKECCPADCQTCQPYNPPPPAMCAAQVHPYVAFNQVEKIIKTW